MKRFQQFRTALLLSVIAMILATNAFAAQVQKSGAFIGPTANTGFVTMTKQNGKIVLTLSDDFVVPDTPDPHWRVVDSKGTVYDCKNSRSRMTATTSR